MTRGDSADASDLWQYTDSVLYGFNVQTQLLGYVLPFCLKAWREDILGTHNGYGGFVEYFYPMLANKGVLDLHLDSSQSAAVADFMRATILEEIDAQHGLTYRNKGAPYRWITALTTYGVLLPDLELLWNSWWSVETVGRATAVVQYVSCLLYAENENSVFSPWTPDDGGGPPCLWEFGGHLYSHRWLTANVAFLKTALTPQAVIDILNKAVGKLADDESYQTAQKVQEDIPLFIETLRSRCDELPKILGTRDEISKAVDWKR
ncbi:MAG TPA: hypothetical protein VI386_29160 [Candidatus Sulfotelmatobacter sp.]